jgi:hypothetical protein
MYFFFFVFSSFFFFFFSLSLSLSLSLFLSFSYHFFFSFLWCVVLGSEWIALCGSLPLSRKEGEARPACEQPSFHPGCHCVFFFFWFCVRSGFVSTHASPCVCGRGMVAPDHACGVPFCVCCFLSAILPLVRSDMAVHIRLGHGSPDRVWGFPFFFLFFFFFLLSVSSFTLRFGLAWSDMAFHHMDWAW